jgi:hypothetical protein
VSEEEMEEGDDDDDLDSAAVINPFRLLGIDEDGEAQYGNGDINDGEKGKFKFKDKSKGAAASFFGSGGSGEGGTRFLSKEDLKESTKGQRKNSKGTR